jgi:hypothetical protein
LQDAQSFARTRRARAHTPSSSRPIHSLPTLHLLCPRVLHIDPHRRPQSWESVSHSFGAPHSSSTHGFVRALVSLSKPVEEEKKKLSCRNTARGFKPASSSRTKAHSPGPSTVNSPQLPCSLEPARARPFFPLPPPFNRTGKPHLAARHQPRRARAAAAAASKRGIGTTRRGERQKQKKKR